MTHINCYDDTDKAIQYLCDAWDMTECEVIDELLSLAAGSDETVAEAVSQAEI